MRNLQNQQQIDTWRRVKNYIYRVADVLGAGNFSRVYLGINQLNNQKVAIKVIQLSSLKIPKLKQLHASEIDVLLKLNHPNTVKCHDIVNTQQQCYIITEVCLGGDLDVFVKKQGFLQQKMAASFIRDIYQGLFYLNSVNVIHRDLKPANVFLSNGKAKIADFGFAVISKQKFRDLNIGSPLYMSPEGYIDCLYGPKTDVWAFGILIYELFHGDTPFSRCKMQNDLKYQLALPFDRSKVRIDLSPQIKQLIFLCLQVDEKKRISVPELRDTNYFKKIYNLSYVSVFSTENAGNHSKSPSHLNQFSNLTRIKSTDNFIHLKREQAQPKIIINQNPHNSPPKIDIKVQNRAQAQYLELPKNHLRPISNEKRGEQVKSAKKLRIRITSIDSRRPIEKNTILTASINFKTAVNILHYARGLFRCIQIMLGLHQKQKDIRYMTSWLILILQELNRKINENQIVYQGINSTVKANKLREVRTDYQKKYTTQLKPYISNFINKPPLSEFKAFLLQIYKKYDILILNQVNESLYQLGYLLVLLFDATRVLLKCKEEGEFTRFQHYKDIEQALAQDKSKFTEFSYLSLKIRIVNNDEQAK